MMFKYPLIILAVCICRLAAAHPLPVPENPTTDSVLAHYKHLPYHLRQSAYEACTFFNQSVADHEELAIINAEGQEFENLEDYKASLEPKAQGKLTAIEASDVSRGQPAWVYANPYMLFFWGVLSNHASLQPRLAENLHNLYYKLKSNLVLRGASLTIFLK